MSFYWLYGRLGVSVGHSDADVREALAAYADEHVKGGRAALTEDHYAGVLREHHDARELYDAVMR